MRFCTPTEIAEATRLALRSPASSLHTASENSLHPLAPEGEPPGEARVRNHSPGSHTSTSCFCSIRPFQDDPRGPWEGGGAATGARASVRSRLMGTAQPKVRPLQTVSWPPSSPAGSVRRMFSGFRSLAAGGRAGQGSSGQGVTGCP